MDNKKKVLITNIGNGVFNQGLIQILRESKIDVSTNSQTVNHLSLNAIIIDYDPNGGNCLGFKNKLIHKPRGIPIFILLPTFLKNGRQYYNGGLLEHLADAEYLNKRGGYCFISLRVPKKSRCYVPHLIYSYIREPETIRKGSFEVSYLGRLIEKSYSSN